jgi:CubicO group peptidase (beta-lactamase class C family)
MMTRQLENIIDDSGILERVDLIEVSFLDLASGKIEIYSFGDLSNSSDSFFFDLASVTKILTNGLMGYFYPEVINEELLLCLEHSSGIPAWGLLSKSNWREEIESFEVTESNTIYSDYGAIRAMLLFEKLTKKNIYTLCEKVWDENTFHWLSGRDLSRYLVTGERKDGIILGDVHDPNAFNVKQPLTHAGVFSTSRGLLKTLKKVFNNEDFRNLLIESKRKKPKKRFHYGWDTPSGESSLAGKGCSELTFGHLGFTGASVWLDLEKNKAISILSNATRDGWYKKKELNNVRKDVGAAFWGA